MSKLTVKPQPGKWNFQILGWVRCFSLPIQIGNHKYAIPSKPRFFSTQPSGFQSASTFFLGMVLVKFARHALRMGARPRVQERLDQSKQHGWNNILNKWWFILRGIGERAIFSVSPESQSTFSMKIGPRIPNSQFPKFWEWDDAPPTKKVQCDNSTLISYRRTHRNCFSNGLMTFTGLLWPHSPCVQRSEHSFSSESQSVGEGFEFSRA